ncbi:uncharacterized protein LOC129222688 [Uloborus diversus]|uniref:uncharacterized protein LOC129222688 n=1 Tax=Uloborus diversus TaxID=327109 RepID=UPI0024097ADA|nr:uncharacterized protein LOC129222688 [Uloborus diversus]
MASFEKTMALSTLKKENSCALHISLSFLKESSSAFLNDNSSYLSNDKEQQCIYSFWKHNNTNMLNQAKQFNTECFKLAKGCVSSALKVEQPHTSSKPNVPTQNPPEMKKNHHHKKFSFRKYVLTNFDINVLSPNSW